MPEWRLSAHPAGRRAPGDSRGRGPAAALPDPSADASPSRTWPTTRRAPRRTPAPSKRTEANDEQGRGSGEARGRRDPGRGGCESHEGGRAGEGRLAVLPRERERGGERLRAPADAGDALRGSVGAFAGGRRRDPPVPQGARRRTETEGAIRTGRKDGWRSAGDAAGGEIGGAQ